MKIQKNDKVKVISGKDRGKTGTVLVVFPEKNKIVVEGINKAKKHVKPGAVSKEGGVISVERAIDVSNVMFLDKNGKSVRLGFKIVDGKKYRISSKTKDVVDDLTKKAKKHGK